MNLASCGRYFSVVAMMVCAGSPLLAQEAAPSGPAVQNVQTVRVTGVVRDHSNAVVLPGVPVEVVATRQVVHTDVDGRYILDLPPGDHQIKVALDGYEPKTITVQANGIRELMLDVALAMSRYSETVDVQGEVIDMQASSAEAQLIERKRANVISDNLGGDEMKRNADGDAAAALQRVTGLSVVDNQYVFVRGLGERYSNTTLNGAVVPTTEPDKKVVPLDMFPSGLLSSVSIVKSYSPDRSAEFAGGLVEIAPLKLPSRTVLDLSWNLGRNSITSGNVLGYAGSGSDWRGFDDGLRSLPSAVPDRKVIRGGIYTPDVGVLQEDLESIGEAFANTWNLGTRSARPNQTGGLTFGARAGKFGVLASYTQSYKEQERSERQVFYRTSGEGLSVFSDYDLTFGTRQAVIGAVGNLAFELNPSNRVTFENFYTHSGKDEARTFEGFNADIATDIRNQRQFWIEEALLSTGLTGEHFVRGMANSRFDWRATFSRAQRDEPDLREVLYERNAGEFVLADESQSGLRMFNALDDDSVDVAANWTTFSAINRRPAQFKFGGQHVKRTRDFSSRRFRFVPLTLSGFDTTQQPEQLYTAANIGSRFEIKEETRPTDFYDAEQDTTAFYGMTDITLSQKLRIMAGARLERFDMQVNTFDLFDFSDDPEIVTGRIEETDIFPSANVVFSPRPDQNLRLGFSQTVNRPEFRELAEFEFTDIVGGRAVVGNPNLKRALIQNYDMRYEVFPGANEVLAASFFVKRFADPIERIIVPTAQLSTSFTNAKSARNIGVELEARRRLNQHVLLGGNYTWVDSNISLEPAAAQVQTSLERALVGQSRNIVNVFVQATAGPAVVRLLYNYFDSRITDVGAQGLPDILEEGRGTLDLVLSARLQRRLNVRLSGENLTDSNYEFTQGGQVQRLFRLGRTFTINFGFSAF